MLSPAFDSGCVTVTFRACAVDVAVNRPNLGRTFGGMAAIRLETALPMLYSICGKAQGVAARLALSAARGEATTPYVDAEVLDEARREHLWRLLLDWPEMLGLPVVRTLVADGQRCLARGDFGTWAAASFVEPMRRLSAALAALPQPSPRSAMALPPLTAEQTLDCWPRLDEAMTARPLFGGETAETGAWAREGGVGATLETRVAARIGELFVPGLLGRVGAVPVAPGVGRSCVETARGLLMHEATLAGEFVENYVIVAPTEWNFHPHGTLRCWLEGVRAAPAELHAMAARAVLALDPCVRCEIVFDGPECDVS